MKIPSPIRHNRRDISRSVLAIALAGPIRTRIALVKMAVDCTSCQQEDLLPAIDESRREHKQWQWRMSQQAEVNETCLNFLGSQPVSQPHDIYAKAIKFANGVVFSYLIPRFQLNFEDTFGIQELLSTIYIMWVVKVGVHLCIIVLHFKGGGV